MFVINLVDYGIKEMRPFISFYGFLYLKNHQEETLVENNILNELSDQQETIKSKHET